MSFTSANTFVLDKPQQIGAWWNYCFNDDTHFTMGPDASGRSVIRQPVIKQWNRGQRWLFLRDRATGAVWCPAWVPLGSELDSYACEHGPVDTTIRSRAHGIDSRIRGFVPAAGQAELWTWELRAGAAARQLDAFLVLFMDDQNMMGWQSAWDAEHGVFNKYAFPHHAHYDDYAKLCGRPTSAIIAPTIAPTSWAGRLGDVTGGACAGMVPAAVAAGELPSQVVANGDPVAALHWRIDLDAESSWRVDWLGTLTDSPAAGRALADDLAADATAVDAAHVAVLAARTAEEGNLTIQSPDADLDRMVNRWHKKQITWQTRLWRNGVSYPLRNILQDAVGYSLYAADEALSPLRTVTAKQQQSGYLKVWTTRPGEAADHPLVHKVHDDGGIWLAICCAAGLHAAGDPALLDETIAYADGGSATWYEHLVQGLRFYDKELGAHGLVLMRDGDWTDPINGPGRFGRGESGWASMALAYACEQVAGLAQIKGDEAVVEELHERRASQLAAIDAHLWTGERYAYGFDDDGQRFGDADDGRTYLNTQTWALLAGCGDADRRQACMAAIDSLATPFGPRLLAPAFPGWDPQVGRLSIKIPGFGENGSVYCHGAAFAAAAFGASGKADACWDIIRRTMPTNADHPAAASKQIPIWQPNAWYGNPDAADFGHSTEALATGTTTWLLLSVVEHLAGFQARIDGIRLQRPLLPADWPELRLTRVLQGCRYELIIRRGDNDSLTVDGEAVTDGSLTYQQADSCLIEWTVSA